MSRIGRLGLVLPLLLAGIGGAGAHPHVWVKARTVVVTDASGTVTALRHRWQFDEAFSSYATLGLDANKDGTLSREELADLAKVNVESLKEYGYFSALKRGKATAEFADPTEYFLEHDGKTLALNFVLPVRKGGTAVQDSKLEVADPSFFVAFEFDGDKAVTVDGRTCTAAIRKPKAEIFERLSKLGENFFQGEATGGLSDDWVTPVTFACAKAP